MALTEPADAGGSRARAAFLRAARPVLFAAACFAAALFAILIIERHGERLGLVSADAAIERRVRAALHAAVPAGEDRHAAWAARVEDALRGDEAGVPDLALARAWLAAAPDVIGRERLAADSLAAGAPAGARARMEADLRARPAWERTRDLAEAYAARLDEAREEGLDPPELVFAPPVLRSRYLREEALAARARPDGARPWDIAALARTPAEVFRLRRVAEIAGPRAPALQAHLGRGALDLAGPRDWRRGDLPLLAIGLLAALLTAAGLVLTAPRRRV
ncbi:MAG: hypothetical protein KIS81_11885 [Maricaulaceae bacterium]|nr:hypothetical protein [Maricaulaceae bacterium]